jgi:hypothetical protein
MIRELRLHLRAWEKHRIYFGIRCARQRLSLCNPLLSTVCVGADAGELSTIEPDGSDVAVRVLDDALTYRFSHGYPDHQKRGTINAGFLDPSMLRRAVLGARSVRTVILPLGHIYRTESLKYPDFLEKLGGFLAVLPGGRRYAVEIHNGEFLLPQYFRCLARCGVSHVLSDSPNMPSLLDQVQLPGVFTSDRVVVYSTASRDAEWQLGILETVRRCLGEKKELRVYLGDGDRCEVDRALHTLAELLSPDLAKLSPLRRKAA